MWNFLNPVVFLANRVPHLAFDQLPPLLDSDEAKNLAKKALPVSLNLSSDIIVGLMRVNCRYLTRSLARRKDTFSGVFSVYIVSIVSFTDYEC